MADLNNTPDCRMSQTLSLLRSFSKYSPNKKKINIKKCYPRNVSNTPLPKSSDPLPNVPLESIEHEESVELQSEVEIKLDPSAKFESEVKIDFVEEADELNREVFTLDEMGALNTSQFFYENEDRKIRQTNFWSFQYSHRFIKNF